MIIHRILCAMKIIGLLMAFLISTVRGEIINPGGSALSLRLVDAETNISPIRLLFSNKKTTIIVEGLEELQFEAKRRDEVEVRSVQNSKETVETSMLSYSTYVNDQIIKNGTIPWVDFWQSDSLISLQSSVDVGEFEVDDSALNSIRVSFYSEAGDGVIQTYVYLDVQSYNQWITIVPIIFSFGSFLFLKVPMVHSLFLAIFIGSCIVEGTMTKGFKAVFTTYILEASANSDGVSVILFTLVMSTLAAMMEKSGGTSAMKKSIRKHSSKTRMAQIAILIIGLIIFMDPYVSVLFVGKIIGSIFAEFPLSREKLSFLLDTTTVPVSSIVPKSTWLSFSADLIDKLIENNESYAFDELNITSGYELVVSSIRFQFYPILILALTALQIFAGREMGPILSAENKARLSYEKEGVDEKLAIRKVRSWNWYIPVVTLTGLLWVGFSRIEIECNEVCNITSPVATPWLVSAGATVIITQIFFIFQRQNGTVPFIDDYFDRDENNGIAYLTDTFPSASGSESIPHNPSSRSEDYDDNVVPIENARDKTILQMNTEEEATGREERTLLCQSNEPALLNLQDGIDCLVLGAINTAEIAICLTLTWATGLMYQNVGIERVILSWVLNDNVSLEATPISVFFASFLISLILGSSLIATSTLIPPVLSALVDSVGTDYNTLAIVLASILSGAAAADHIGPFSESTIFASILSGAKIRDHCLTQAPYGIFVLVVSVLIGTLPVSLGGYPDYVGYIIGIGIISLFVILVCRQVNRYQSGISGISHNQPASQGLKTNLYPEDDVARSEERSVMSFQYEFEPEEHAGENDYSDQRNNAPSFTVKQSNLEEGTEVVDIKSGDHPIPIVNQAHKDHSLDPVVGLAEAGVVKKASNEKNRRVLKRKKISRSKEQIDAANTSKTRLIEATIKKAEQDSKAFSDSLRTFLRTAEQKLGNILEQNEKNEVVGSRSGESNGDDSLDNLMLNIASKGWRASINNILGDGNETVTSGGEDYTTDGGSSILESDDSATATTFSFGRGGPRTYYSGHGDITSCGSSTTGLSAFSTGTSQLLNPLDLEKSRQSLHEWVGQEEDSTAPDDFTANAYTQASF